jgi:hypothetical protein
MFPHIANLRPKVSGLAVGVLESLFELLVLLDASGERHAVLLGLGRAFPLLWYRG